MKCIGLLEHKGSRWFGVREATWPKTRFSTALDQGGSGLSGALLVAVIVYGYLVGPQVPTVWSEEAKAPAAKAAEKPDLPDQPPDASEKPSDAPEKEPAAPKTPEKAAEKSTEKATEKPSSPSSKEKAPPEPKTPSPTEKSAPGPSEPATPKPPVSTGKPKAAEPLVEWPVNEEQRKNRLEVPKILQSGNLNAEQVKLLTDYYTQYGLARWTLESQRAEVRKYRNELLSELRQAEGKAHDQAIEIVLPLLTKMAEGNHAPVARLNAMLALGELNRVEAKPGKTPEPLPATQPILLRFLQNPDAPDAIRVAALVGIMRHAELGAVADSTKPQVAGVLAALAQERTPSGESPAGHAWLRSLAIDALGVLKTPGQNGQVVVALLAVLADGNTPLGVRTAAARALGALDYSQGFPADLNKTVQEMGQAALDALQQELEGYKKEKKFLSRRLQTYLIAVYNGLVGLEKAAAQSADKGALHKKTLEAVRNCLLVLENPKLRDSQADLVQELTKQVAVLNDSLSAPVSPPPTEKPKT